MVTRALYALWLGALLVILAVCLRTRGEAAPAPPRNGGWGVNLANLDRSVPPCTDFYAYATNGWRKMHPIPAAYASWEMFSEVNRRNEIILHRILETDSAAHAAVGTNKQKVGDFFATGMDKTAIERAGIRPIRPLLSRIDGLRSIHEIGGVLADLQDNGVDVLFDMGSAPDAKNSAMVIADASQGGLGLPDRDYYTKTDAASVKLRDQYVAHVAKMLALLGTPQARADADAHGILALETDIAKASYTNVELRDPHKNYHRTTLTSLAEMAPGLDWWAYYRGLGLSPSDTVNVEQVTFFEQVAPILKRHPLPIWKAYLRYHLVESLAGALPSAFNNEAFNFSGRILSGSKEQLPRWKRVLHTINAMIGEALGQEFVKAAFPPSSKAHAKQMVANIRQALADDFPKLDWMGPQTKAAAEAKLKLMNEKIGYPDRWRDYSALHIKRDSYARNVMRAARFETARELKKIGHPPDRSEWGMNPQTVNAYYDPQLNEIVFPAAILQPPFFDEKADDAVNYGGIGMVIGHEMTHGFDDQGSQYDGHGNLRNWWTKDDLARFKARAKCIADEFDGFVVAPGVKENGSLENGEAIADLGGLTLSWIAYQHSLEGKPAPPVLDGFTSAQRFFLGYGQIWAANLRPKYAKLLANTDPHPLPQFRVDGTLANFQPFWEAFGCKEGEAMVRNGDRHCKIW